MPNTVVPCVHCGKPNVIPDAPSLPANLNDVCRQWPELCAIVKAQREQLNVIARNVAELPKRNEHLSPNQDVIQDWLDCPDCKPKFEALVKEHPELFEPEEPKVKKYAWERD